MSELTIKTDYKWKNFLCGYELTEKEKKEFDWMNAEEIDTGSFLRYKKSVYGLNEFMVIPQDNPFKGKWSGYISNSYFSGILIEISKDAEQYRIGRFYN